METALILTRNTFARCTGCLKSFKGINAKVRRSGLCPMCGELLAFYSPTPQQSELLPVGELEFKAGD